MSARIAKDAYVVLDYALHDEDGDLIEATDEPSDDGPARPIGFVYGYGTLVPGLEARLIGMAAGETREVEVPPEEGYGAWLDDKEIWVAREELPSDIAIDDEFDATDEDGEEISMRIVEIAEDAVLVDTNHPLAGETLFFDVIVRSVRPATKDEIARTRAAAPRPSLPLVAAPAAPARPAPEAAGPRPAQNALEEPTRAEGDESAPDARPERGGRRGTKLTDDEQ